MGYVNALRLREFQRIRLFSHLSMIFSDNVYDYFFSLLLLFCSFSISLRCLSFTSHFNQTGHILFAILSLQSVKRPDDPFEMRFHLNDIAPVYELVHIFNNVNQIKWWLINTDRSTCDRLWCDSQIGLNYQLKNVNWFLLHENRQYIINLRNLYHISLCTLFIWDC